MAIVAEGRESKGGSVPSSLISLGSNPQESLRSCACIGQDGGMATPSRQVIACLSWKGLPELR